MPSLKEKHERESGPFIRPIEPFPHFAKKNWGGRLAAQTAEAHLEEMEKMMHAARPFKRGPVRPPLK